MLFQVSALSKSLVTEFALEWLLPSVHSQVILEEKFIGEPFLAITAIEKITGVDPFMDFEEEFVAKWFLAIITVI